MSTRPCNKDMTIVVTAISYMFQRTASAGNQIQRVAGALSDKLIGEWKIRKVIYTCVQRPFSPPFTLVVVKGLFFSPLLYICDMYNFKIGAISI